LSTQVGATSSTSQNRREKPGSQVQAISPVVSMHVLRFEQVLSRQTSSAAQTPSSS
jgi:hypothetical protein